LIQEQNFNFPKKIPEMIAISFKKTVITQEVLPKNSNYCKKYAKTYTESV
jgi:hypothetical protein